MACRSRCCAPPTGAWSSSARRRRRHITTTVTRSPVQAPQAVPAEARSPTLSWDVARDLSQLLEYHFMVNALLAGSVVAVMAGLVGWVMVLRGETFAGHTLAMLAFPGASGAALIGVPAAWGYFA